MHFIYDRNLSNNIFTTETKFEKYGDEKLSVDEEKSLIEDFGPATINIGGEFKSRIKLNEKGKPEIVAKPDEKSPEGDEVSFVLNSEYVQLDEKFSAVYSVDALKIECPKENKVLTNKYILAEAQCVLFEKEVKKRIDEELKKFKKQQTDFEKNCPDSFIA